MIVNWQIDVGAILQIASVLLGGLFFMWSMKARIDLMSLEVQSLKSEVKQLADILTKIAVQDQRILSMEKDIDEMRHGAGFIVKPPILVGAQ